MAIDNNPTPSVSSLRLATTLAADKAKKAGVNISKADLLDMTDRAVSSKDLAIANVWVEALQGYVKDEDSFADKLTALGAKDLSKEKASTMLAAAEKLQSAVSKQLAAQGPLTTIVEETKDQFRTPIRFVRDHLIG